MMMYINYEKCIECGSCAPFCKNGAIDWIDHRYVIDQTKCECCGTCKGYCPIDDAIKEFRVNGAGIASGQPAKTPARSDW